MKRSGDQIVVDQILNVRFGQVLVQMKCVGANLASQSGIFRRVRSEQERRKKETEFHIEAQFQTNSPSQ